MADPGHDHVLAKALMRGAVQRVATQLRDLRLRVQHEDRHVRAAHDRLHEGVGENVDTSDPRVGVYGEFVRKTGSSRDGRRRIELPVAATVS